MELEFLDGGEPPKEEVQPVVEPPAEPPAEPVAETEPTAEKPAPVRGPDGKFAKKEPEEPVMVPLKALHETRDEVRALKAQLEAFNQPREQQQAPDIFEDPDGFRNHMQSEMQRQILNTTLNLSEEMVTQQVGADTVEQAKQWGAEAFQANPGLYQSFIQQRNPYGFLVAEYQKQTLLSQVGNDPKEIQAFLAWRQAQQAQPPAALAAQTQPVVRPTGSIASAPSAGGAQHQAVGPGVAFDEVIR